MIQGSCLCGAVRFQLDGAPAFLNHCHCRMCRKATGAAFGTFLHAPGRGFAWLTGQQNIRAYESSPGNYRPFCSICGSRLPVLEDGGAEVIIPAGTLDTDPVARPIVHYHVGSKAPWAEICDGLPQFAEFPPDAFWDRIPRPE